VKLTLRPLAERDLDDQADYLEAQAGMETARRFYLAAREIFAKLLEMPEMGTPRIFDNPELSGLRSWPVRGFEKHLIFYRTSEGGIEVLRVLHGARDLESILQEGQ
jgi:toxin ParE1/3/4